MSNTQIYDFELEQSEIEELDGLDECWCISDSKEMFILFTITLI